MVFGLPTMYHRIGNEAEHDEEIAAALVGPACSSPARLHSLPSSTSGSSAWTGKAILER